MNDVFEPAGQNTTAPSTSLFKLTQLLQKINHRQVSLSRRSTENVYTYKHRVEKHFFAGWIMKKKTIFIATSNRFWNVNDVFMLLLLLLFFFF